MNKQTPLFMGLMINLFLSSGCTTVAGTLASWDGARINIASPANLGTKSLFGISWCTAPDRICQKSLPGVELKPGMIPGGGGIPFLLVTKYGCRSAWKSVGMMLMVQNTSR
ncbi:MAG: hypothetical protein KZQ96_07040 [Candidatus Thiodiazotropha sp. (ex Lucinoma borealis)]|nr:hypothetical protein [Candidatus Thiodiazotropha sp. (ex Lucinoma borealis)]